MSTENEIEFSIRSLIARAKNLDDPVLLQSAMRALEVYLDESRARSGLKPLDADQINVASSDRIVRRTTSVQD